MEEQINGVENMLYMSSQSTGDGHLTITVTFQLGTDLNEAQVDGAEPGRGGPAAPVPRRCATAASPCARSLPDFLLAVHMFSPDGCLSQQYVANYAGLQVRDPLLRICTAWAISPCRAARDYLHAHLDRSGRGGGAQPHRRRHHRRPCRATMCRSPPGALGAPPVRRGGGRAYQLDVQALGRLTDPQQFADIVVKRDAQTAA